MADLGTLTVKLGVDAKDAEVQVKQFTDKVAVFSKSTIAHLATVSQQFRTIGYLFSAVVTAPIVLATKSVAKMAMEYEFSIQKIVGLTGTAQNVVNQWSKSIQNMSKEFGRKPKELAEALYFIASSGIEGAEALEVLKMSAKAAASGLGETQDIANYLTSVLNAYRGTGLTAAYATDVLVAAVREGKAEAQGFAAAMGSLTPIASNLGVSIDQVAGAMAAITLTGSTAAQAATYLRGMFNVLMKETEKGADAMDEASAALGTMKTSYADLRKILREQGVMALMEKLNELSAAYGETLVSKVFPNIRSILAVLSLSGKNMKYNSQIIKEVTNSSGALGKAFAAVADTIKIRYDKAISSMEVSMIKIGAAVANNLIPLLENLSKRIERLADWFDGLTDAQKKNKLIMVGVLAAIAPVSMALSVFGYTLTYVMRVVNLFTKALAGLNTMLSLVGITAAKAGVKFMFLRKIVNLKNFFGNILTYIMKIVNLFTKTLVGMLSLIGITAAKAGAKFMFLRKIVNLKNFFGTGASNILTAFKNPWILATTGAVTATVAISKYAKKIKEIASDNELFNKSMVKVNDSMKKFKDLSSIDYETMSLDQLVAAREEARKVWTDAYNLYKQYEKNLEASMQSNKKNKKLMEDQARKIEFAKKVYDDLGNAIEDYQSKFTAARLAEQAAAAEQKAAETQEYNEALQEVWSTMLAEISAAEELAKVYAVLGKSFSLADEKANIFLKTIEILTGEKFELKFDSSPIQTLITWLKELKFDFSDLKKATDEYNASLAAIDMKKLLLGPSFDADTEKLETYQNYLDEIIKSLSKKKPSEITLIDRETINEQLKLIEETRKRIDEITDRNTIKLLQAEADAFGTIAGQVEVLNFAIQAEERALRSMLKVFIEGSKTGEKITWEQIQEAANRIQNLKAAYVDAQNAMDMQFLEDMNNALRTADTGADLLQGRIKALENTLKTMSDNGQGATVAFKFLAKEMQTLLYAQKGVDILSDAFTDLFTSVINGSKNMGEILEGIFNQIINQIIQMISQMIAMRLMMMIIGAATGGPIAAVSTANLTIPKLAPSLPGLQQFKGFAKGGIVPPGYPNDSFPARLTSNEAIIPLNQLDKYDFGQTVTLDANVRFEIEGDKLVAIIKKQSKRNSLY
ncbi:MAG: phage tail tape measure protein [Melioribacter sp.]|nr:phage tail tape measure protein [Melioribacter sp.]